MKQERMIQLILQGAGIETDNDQNFDIGWLNPAWTPSGIDLLMQVHTQEISALQKLLPVGSEQRKRLDEIRGFTFAEYQQLFSPVTEHSKDFAIFRILQLQEKDRKRLILEFSKDRHDDYVRCLASCLVSFHAHNLPTFFFPSCFERSYKVRCAYPNSSQNGWG